MNFWASRRHHHRYRVRIFRVNPLPDGFEMLNYADIWMTDRRLCTGTWDSGKASGVFGGIATLHSRIQAWPL